MVPARPTTPALLSSSGRKSRQFSRGRPGSGRLKGDLLSPSSA